MPYSFPTDVQQLVEAHLASGRYLTENDVLRVALRALTNKEQDLDAVREAIAECRTGDNGIALTEAFDQLRNNSSDEPGA